MKIDCIAITLLRLSLRQLIVLTLVGLLCSGCATSPMIQLHWDTHTKVNYRITRQPFPGNMKVDVNAMLADPKFLREKIGALKALPLKPGTFSMRLSMGPGTKGVINVLAKNVRVHYPTQAKDATERRLREMQQHMLGLVQLNTIINEYGENQDPYIKPLQYNLVTQLFQFPNHPVAVGETWHLPVVLTSLNTPFLANKTHRVNKVWVNAITDKPGVGKVAEIVYLLQENIQGLNQQLITEKPRPFVVTSSYFAVGEYQLSKHQWIRYVGRLATTIGIIHSVSLIALVPDNEARL